MCKKEAYYEIKKIYEQETNDISVRIFFGRNEELCSKHGITLSALQKKITRDGWTMGIVQNVQKNKIVVQNPEIVQKISEELVLPNGTKELSERQKNLCREIVIDENIPKACKRAGYSESYGRVDVYTFLANPRTVAFMAILRAEKIKDKQINAREIVDSILEIRTRCLQKEPVMKFDNVSKEYAQKIDNDTGEGVWTFESSSALKANDMLMKHVGGYDADNRQKASVVMSDEQFAELCRSSKGMPVDDLLAELD